MIRPFTLSFLCLLFFSCHVSAQYSLSNAPERSRYTYVYKLTEREAIQLAFDFTLAGEQYLHTKIDSFENVRKVDPGFGTFLVVRTQQNKVVYRLDHRRNVQIRFLNDQVNLQFVLLDDKGNRINNASCVFLNGRQISFDPVAQAYITNRIPDEKLIRVSYQNVTNLFRFEKEKASPARLYYRRNEADPDERFTGYMAFSKSKYRPLDSVQLKAYVVGRQGRELKHEEATAYIVVDGEPKLLSKVKPYRPGGYILNFQLDEQLKLTLDRHYQVILKDARHREMVSSGFKYEDYLLKSTTFNVRRNKELHSPGSPVIAWLKAVDENNLAVPDGRVTVTALTISTEKTYGSSVFVADTLWKHDLLLDPAGETKLIFPDSIFPKAKLSFEVQYEFRNSDNETRSNRERYRYDPRVEVISSKFEKDSIMFNYEYEGKPVSKQAILERHYATDAQPDSLTVHLPFTIKHDSRFVEYTVTAGEAEHELQIRNFQPLVATHLHQRQDSLYAHVSNPRKIPFWYTIFSGDDVMLKGYSTELDTVFKYRSSKATHLRVNYLWDTENVRNDESVVSTNNTVLNVELEAPEIVYPGQEVTMKVKVTDKQNRPVKHTDITAHAYTVKLPDPNLELPDFEPVPDRRQIKQEFEEDDFDGNERVRKLDANLFGMFGLDQSAYYRFTNPKGIYTYVETMPDTVTHIVPMVMIDGLPEPVHLLYVDDRPIYFSKSTQLKHYAFPVTPGKHNLRLRTLNYDVTIRNVEVLPGKRNYLSVSPRTKHPDVTVENVSPMLTDWESGMLLKYLIPIEDNFGARKSTLKAGKDIWLLNQMNRTVDRLLIGPVYQNIFSFESEDWKQQFTKRPGHVYTFSKGHQSSDATGTYGFSQVLSRYEGTTNFRQPVLTSTRVDSIWTEYLDNRSMNSQLFPVYYGESTNMGRVTIDIDKKKLGKMPVKNVLFFRDDELDFTEVYPGAQEWLFSKNKPAGNYRVMYLLKDNRYFVIDTVVVTKGGGRFYQWSPGKISPADKMSNAIDSAIKANHMWYADEKLLNKIAVAFNDRRVDYSKFKKTLSGRLLKKADSIPLRNIWVNLKGTSHRVKTDNNGRFKLTIPENGSIAIDVEGMTPVSMKFQGDPMVIYVDSLTALQYAIEGILVTGVYGAKQTPRSATNNLQTVTINALAGKVAGVQVRSQSAAALGRNTDVRLRGGNGFGGGTDAIYVIDGVIVQNADKLNLDEIGEVTVLQGPAAVALFGSRGTNGAVVIVTKKAASERSNSGETTTGQSMRRNFSDVGFWQPKLTTDAKGETEFKVKFPDDITNWSTRVVAMTTNRQSGSYTTHIKSFKKVSANLVVPQFATMGDTLSVIGKIMNYSVEEQKINRSFKYNGTLLKQGDLKVKNAHIDTIRMIAGTDSLRLEYTLNTSNSYFDGEQRKLPVIKAGTMETKGFFAPLWKDTTFTKHFDPLLGKVTFRAEASLFPVLLDEFTKLKNYKYLCNEQLASKLKSLMLGKKVRGYLGERFAHERDIKKILDLLRQNRRAEGTWGWWQNTSEEMWISLHVAEALLEAEEQQYGTHINKTELYKYIHAKATAYAGRERLYAIRLLQLLDPAKYVADLADQVNVTKQHLSLHEKLTIMDIKQRAGLKVNIDSLLAIKKNTLFGGIYWGEESMRFWDNSVQNTLIAYRILSRAGNYKSELERIQAYFLEQRKNGEWRNTYESAQILDVIVPDLLSRIPSGEKPSLTLNGHVYNSFPVDQELDPGVAMQLKKTGDMPVYVTGHQQFHNAKPQPVSKEFAVKTSFVEKGLLITKLTGGTPVTMQIEVDVKGDADYVMIEVPIPAGCTYENKNQYYWGVETYREYFKEQTSIFCTKLKQGKHTYNIELMPRFGGNYVLNPAKASLMYFPVLYGRNGMNRVVIR